MNVVNYPECMQYVHIYTKKTAMITKRCAYPTCVGCTCNIGGGTLKGNSFGPGGFSNNILAARNSETNQNENTK